MAQLLNIVDDKVIINKLAVKYLEGTIYTLVPLK